MIDLLETAALVFVFTAAAFGWLVLLIFFANAVREEVRFMRAKRRLLGGKRGE